MQTDKTVILQSLATLKTQHLYSRNTIPLASRNVILTFYFYVFHVSSWQRNLTEYFVAVDVNNMLQLYASMLHERRIIITSSKLSTVSSRCYSHLHIQLSCYLNTKQ